MPSLDPTRELLVSLVLIDLQIEVSTNKTWILIADAHQARCFERDASDDSLIELADFAYPHASLAQQSRRGYLTGAAGKVHGRTGHAGTQFEPHMSCMPNSGPALPVNWKITSSKWLLTTGARRW